ncbi:MAG: hypothetical protein Tsb009_32780 [Planctomycetaceae bacterium]
MSGFREFVATATAETPPTMTSADAVIPVGEMIKIELGNEIQRIERTVRGAVREQVPFKENLHRIRVELFSRLTPYDVLLLKTSLKN